MKNLQNKTAVVTGAASGIGRCLAQQLAAEGCRLAISDVNEEGLKETVGLIEAKQNGSTPEILSVKLDVSNREAVYAHADEVLKKFGGADIVINNAGVVAMGEINEIGYDDFEFVMGVNFWGVLYGTKAFLPHMLKQSEGSIVNISSVNGFVPFPANGAYNCSKYAVYGLNETLHQELAGTGVVVSSVHPGGIKTNIVRNAKFDTSSRTIGSNKNEMVKGFDRIAMTTADSAAATIIRGIKGKRKKILIGLDAHAMDAMKRLVPEQFVSMVALATKINPGT